MAVAPVRLPYFISLKFFGLLPPSKSKIERSDPTWN